MRLLQISILPNYVYLKQRWNSIRHAWISWKPKQSYSPPSQLFFKISEKCDDPNLQSFAQELSTPDPSLQKNLGIVTESTNLKFLATSIEMHETIAVGDASVGSRQCAAHSYILMTKCGRGKIKISNRQGRRCMDHSPSIPLQASLLTCFQCIQVNWRFFEIIAMHCVKIKSTHNKYHFPGFF